MNGKPGSPGLDRPIPVGLAGVGSSAVWSVLGLLLNNVGAFVGLAVGVRVLGNEEYGVFIVLNSLLLLAGLLQGGLALTMQYAAAKGLSGDKGARQRLQAGHSIYCYLSVVLIAFGLLLAAALPLLVDVPRGSLTAARLTCVLLALTTAVNWAAMAFSGLVAGMLRYDLLFASSAVNLVVRVLVLVGTIGSLGLVSLGLSPLCGAVAGVLYLLLRVRGKVHWLRLKPGSVRWTEVRGLAAFALPLFLLSGSTTLIATSDVLLIAALAGPAAVTMFRVGLQVPQMAQALCYTAYSNMYPRMAREETESQTHAVAVSSAWLCFAGAAGFTSLIVMRDDILRLLVGQVETTSSTIFAIYGVLFALNLCFHPWVILILARGRQSLMAKMVPFELGLNLTLTAVFVAKYGVLGSAYAAVCSTALANLVLYPLITRGFFNQNALFLVLRNGVVPALTAAVFATPIALALRHSTEGMIARLSLALPLSFVLTLLFGLILVRSEGRERLRKAFTAS